MGPPLFDEGMGALRLSHRQAEAFFEMAFNEALYALGECPEWQRGGTVNPLL